MDAEDKSLLRRLHDKLDEHTNETRQRWEAHEKDHRAHDKEHSEIGQWQVKTEGRLRDGAETIAELRDRTKPPSWSVVAAAVLAVVGLPVSAVLWVNNGLAAKADRAVEDKVAAMAESKADRADVNSLTAKIDKLTNAVIQTLEKTAPEKGAKGH